MTIYTYSLEIPNHLVPRICQYVTRIIRIIALPALSGEGPFRILFGHDLVDAEERLRGSWEP
ncbi:hypothetical protein N7491_011057 [Penicillium cf. griseofulvum]|uniref:Uncharacterized protein n=1 Tax=Penicillium cf. griseofulvum TaxID=2972120 RepID=A0A9W9N196_9EURO|nr:hypothetical protein N7472_001376 [Penicillium cf. griseofulvum]KAJ5422612.1 hypothetical protein N7491_011057 [Penicillium cf. griseofulvum]KAJ5428789.1 hypothetical protein N7445_010243 [Penicillium cf. griseofulvum]